MEEEEEARENSSIQLWHLNCVTQVNKQVCMCTQRHEGGGFGPQSPEEEELDNWMSTRIRKVDHVLQHHHT